MDTINKSATLLFLLFSILIIPTINAQNIPEPNAACAYCNAKLGSPHLSSCPYYRSANSTSKKTSSNISSPNLNTMVTTMVFQSLLDAVFSINSGPTKQEIEAQQQAAAIAKKQAEEQKIQEAKVAQAKYNKMMESFKTIDGHQDIQSKTLDQSGLHFKTLDEMDKLKSDEVFDASNTAWIEQQKENFAKRLEEPNPWCNSIYNSLKTDAPPLPYKKFDELQPGDVLLFAPQIGTFDGVQGSAVADISNFGQKRQESNISHTVTFLKETNGKKLFMDNMPGEGPVIISEDELRKRYEGRDASVAKLSGLAQPLNTDESEKLWEKAKEMQTKNSEFKNNSSYYPWSDESLYGVGKDNVVCSKASWALLKSAGRDLPLSQSWITNKVGVDFSPADFYAYKQYFLVTPLSLK
ncbi:MAG: hypothetical protein WC389_00285 [Lutibacter sp.]